MTGADVTRPRPLPLPKSLPDVLTPAYLAALRHRPALHLAWHDECGCCPDSLDADDPLPCPHPMDGDDQP